jgi:regulator of nucleoside diphosphate kinase
MTIKRYLTQNDAARLAKLAEQLLRVRDVGFNAAEKLIELIATSVVLPENSQRSDCVTLNSEVEYRKYGTDEIHTAEITCAHDVDDILSHAAVLTPLALAMIGRPVGSIVEVRQSRREAEYFEIQSVRDLSAEAIEPADSPAA